MATKTPPKKKQEQKKKKPEHPPAAECAVMLIDIGSNKIGVAKVVREFMGCPIAEARKIVEGALPKELRLPATAKPEDFKAKIVEAGGKLEIMNQVASGQPPSGDAAAKPAGDKDKAAPATPAGDLVAHLFTGKRDVRITLREEDYVKVLKQQQEVTKVISDNEAKFGPKDEQILEAEEKLKRLRAERRDIEEIIENARDRLVEIVNANSDGKRIERMEVDELFMNGEIIIKRKGTGEEVGRRNATAAEWAEAQKIKDKSGKPVERWKKGTPQPDGTVKLEDGKVVPGDGEMGYIGPEEDPSRPPKKKKGDKDGKKKAREPKTQPVSLRDKDSNEEGDDSGE